MVLITFLTAVIKYMIKATWGIWGADFGSMTMLRYEQQDTETLGLSLLSLFIQFRSLTMDSLSFRVCLLISVISVKKFSHRHPKIRFCCD